MKYTHQKKGINFYIPFTYWLRVQLIFMLFILSLVLGVILGIVYFTKMQKPIIISQPIVLVKTAYAIENTKKQWIGVASYYSRKGCVGCNAGRIMANRKPLVDANLTLAFQRLPLGSMVKITNLKNNMFVMAEVTDRGGFEKKNRIADLSEGTKNSINCDDLCKVGIEEL